MDPMHHNYREISNHDTTAAWENAQASDITSTSSTSRTSTHTFCTIETTQASRIGTITHLSRDRLQQRVPVGNHQIAPAHSDSLAATPSQQHIQVGGHHTPTAASHAALPQMTPNPQQHIPVGRHTAPPIGEHMPLPPHMPPGGRCTQQSGRVAVGNHGQIGHPSTTPELTDRVVVGDHKHL